MDVTAQLADPDRDYRDPAEQLSVGMFSNIYLGSLRSGTSVAIKSLRVAKIVFRGKIIDGWNPRPHINIAHELYVRSQCIHPHILELIGAAEFQGRLATISPVMENGDMYHFLAQNSDVNLCKMCSQLADAVTYLHRKDIAHGGIHLFNIMVSEDKEVKLAGFGGAILCNSPVEFEGYCVENNHLLIWMAPELQEGTHRQSLKSDVYALGVTILQIVTKAENYRDSNGIETELIGHLRTAPPRRAKTYLPSHNAEANRLWDMLTSCWRPDPNRRPTAAEVGNTVKSVSDVGLK
ncbi:unnamed protein product [Rhizoctonia solani]|uniref:Protein kinase domain-containing protein n=1 Tax=Rhizoctonia solani TaxID=456999 RepID=A0A8H3H760_9AGAM|nr:unnamed protein product [Rhizoctonia solani]